MSMAINRVSAAGVAAMLYPVIKPSRVAKVSGGARTSSSASRTAAQGTSQPQPADTSSTADQAHAEFAYALAALGNLNTTGAVTQPSPDQVQTGVVQQASAFAQVEQAAGQTLDLTA